MENEYILTVRNVPQQSTIKYLIDRQYKWWTAELYDLLKKINCYTMDRYFMRHGQTETNELFAECLWRVQQLIPINETSTLQPNDKLFCGTIILDPICKY